MEKNNNIITKVNNYGDKIEGFLYKKLEKNSKIDEIKSKIKELKDKIEELEFDNTDDFYDFDVSYLEEIEKEIDNNKTTAKAEIKNIKNEVDIENIKFANDKLKIGNSLIIDGITYIKNYKGKVINMGKKIDNSQVENVQSDNNQPTQIFNTSEYTDNEPYVTNDSNEKLENNVGFENINIVPSKSYKTNLENLYNYFNGDRNKGKEVIISIQEKLVSEGKIKNEDIGKFGPATGKYIYEFFPEYYSKGPNKNEQIKSLKLMELNKDIDKNSIINNFHKNLDGYNTKTRNSKQGGKIMADKNEWLQYKLTISDKLNYGNYGYTEKYNTFPLKGTAIAEGLSKYNTNEPKLEGAPKNNNIYILKNSFNNKFTLHYYLGGKLRVTTYVSPGATKSRSEKVKNVKIGGQGSISTNHISDSNDPKNRENSKTGWVMPNAIHIPTVGKKNLGQFLHASLQVTGDNASHGCTRVPPFYMEVLAQYLGNLSSSITILDN